MSTDAADEKGVARLVALFEEPTRQRLLSAIERLLRPGGLLCIGHTETLSGIRSSFKMQRPSVFRRPEEAVP